MNSIDNAKRIINSQPTTNNNYSNLYLFTNENINAMEKIIDLSNKNILTVCSSSDQYFNFLLNNNTNISTFDKNILTEYLYYYKKAGIINLEFDEYIEFFMPKRIIKNKLLSKEIYNQKIKQDLPDKIQIFWNELYKNYKGIELFKSNLFQTNKYYYKLTLNNNKYLQENNYYKLKEKLKNEDEIIFYTIDIFKNKIPTKNKYDFIYLSNILEYLEAPNTKEYLKKVKIIIKELSKNLNEEGIIALQYLFTYLDDYTTRRKNDLRDIINYNTFIKKECTLITFEGGLTNYKNRIKDLDGLLLYKKKKY